MLLSLAKRDPIDRAEAMRPAAKQPAHVQTQPSIKVFVSYSRADLAFADKLVAALEAHDIEVRIDRRDLPFAREWQEELVEMVRWADTVLFIISPDCDRLEMVRVGTSPGRKVPEAPRADRLSAGRKRSHPRGAVEATAHLLRAAQRLRCHGKAPGRATRNQYRLDTPAYRPRRRCAQLEGRRPSVRFPAPGRCSPQSAIVARCAAPGGA